MNPAWDAYWGEQRLAACLRDQEGNYGGCIAKAWQDYFRQVPVGSRILDIATGNGAVALLGLKTSDKQSLDLSFDACDAAQIDPESSLGDLRHQLRRIRFRGGVRAEELPYESDAFDALSSQYGIEYSDWRQSLAECMRVLKPGGCLMFICHSTRSSVYATTQEQLRALQHLRNMNLTHTVGDLLDSEPLGGSLHEQNLHRFRRDAASVMDRLDNSPAAQRTFIGHYLQRLGDIYQGRRSSGAQDARDGLTALDRDLGFHEDRLQALSGAAVDEKGIADFQQCLASNGFRSVESGPLADPGDGSELGWRFHARLAVRNG